MRRTAVTLVLAALFLACGKMSTVPSKPGPPEAIHFASLDPVQGLVRLDQPAGRPPTLTLGSDRITSPWLLGTPQAWSLEDGGHLLERSGDCFVAPKHTDRVYAVGTCEVVRVGSRGTLAVRRGRAGTWEILHVDPRGPSLERLAVVTPPPRASLDCAVAGMHRGAPLAICRTSAEQGTVETVTAYHVLGPGHVETRPLPLSAGEDFVRYDAIRGDRLLVLRETTDTAVAAPSVRTGPLDGLAKRIAIGIHDLGTGQERTLGTTTMRYTRTTDAVLPCLLVHWRDTPIVGMEEHCDVTVDPVTEAVTPAADPLSR